MQINFGADNNTVGFTNQNINNNDFSEVNGACINLATVDPSRGYVNVNNNILHHCGIQEASDSIRGAYESYLHCQPSRRLLIWHRYGQGL